MFSDEESGCSAIQVAHLVWASVAVPKRQSSYWRNGRLVSPASAQQHTLLPAPSPAARMAEFHEGQSTIATPRRRHHIRPQAVTALRVYGSPSGSRCRCSGQRNPKCPRGPHERCGRVLHTFRRDHWFLWCVFSMPDGGRGKSGLDALSWLLAAMGATFALTESVVANHRQKDDALNGVAGGCAAGFLAGIRCRWNVHAFERHS